MKIIISNDIEIQKAPQELIQEIKKRLTMHNPKYWENERMGYNNRGVPRYLAYYMEEKNAFAVPRGFYNELLQLCIKKPDILDLRRVMKPINFSFIGQLRPYQQTATNAILKEDQGVLQAPTGSGKTIQALAIIAERKQPTLIIVHTKELLHQWKDRINTFLGIDKEEIGTIGDGKKTVGKKITVAMVQTLYGCAEKVYPKIGHLVVDECHRIPSRTMDEAISWFDCKYLLGLSATPYRRDKLTNLIFWFIGPKLHEIQISEMIDKEAITPIDVTLRETLFTTRRDPKFEYAQMLKELTENQDRNELIIQDVIKEAENGTALILSDRKIHCEALRFIVEQNGYKATLLTGDTNNQERKNIVNRINEGKENIIIATGQLMGEGFDCKNLSSLFLATPIRFSGRLLQYIGRVLRPAKGKEKAMIYDYVDVHVKQLLYSAKARISVYKKEFNCDEKLFQQTQKETRGFKALHNRRNR